GVADSLGPGQTVIDTTTGDPTQMAALGDRLGVRGVAYLDATVSGSSEQARRGDVVLMVGGDGRVFASCGDLFGAMARAAFHVGPTGSGAKMKLATNLVLGLNRMALAEGLALARGLGLDLGLTLAVLRESAAYSRAMDAKGAKMIARDFTPQARLSQHLKDVRLILDEARRVGVASPLSEAHRTMLEAAVGAGHGDADNSAIFLAYDRPRP
ncbi:MAG: NAD(P)-dependent oxidoreductase, partial [Singulisphaera sp.]